MDDSILTLVSQASITSITTVEGESTVGFSRGKKRYIYDMSVDLKWKVHYLCFTPDMNVTLKSVYYLL